MIRQLQRALGALPRPSAAHGSRISVSQQRSLYRGSTSYATETSFRTPGMTIKSLPACFVRGGTSNGLIIHRKDLPKDVEDWQPILSAAMGSPDGYGRQLDGMGSGVSSTSKVCVVEKSSRVDADLDFTFVQVGIKDGSLDLAGNCGNMSSAIGPFGFSEGLLHNVYENGETEKHKEVTTRIFNTNTKKLINATFSVTKDGVYDPFGDYSIDGVPGTGSCITLSFLDPSGAKTGKALPTGNAVDNVKLPDGTSIRASLVDVANPGVFILAEDIGVPGDITPATLEEQTEIMSKLEHIRQEGARMMGMEPAQTVPKIVLVSRPTSEDSQEGVHIVCRALSMQQPHKAVPLTLALNLGASCRMPGTLPADVAVGDPNERESLTIAHASGKVEVGSIFEDGKIKSAQLHRTARIMMKGDVFYTAKT
ncbi:3-methylitaconate isomerase [Pseudocercospora fuligena]|uniref:3-methylitaconate isomerase n=1 Tax=Pseudocercospora fuligena TaxID=685502 RepID=A0A8H6RHD1_9PEZI|nr:3-methylitaconate isomerase [Pseudocercospora fuligena]